MVRENAASHGRSEGPRGPVAVLRNSCDSTCFVALASSLEAVEIAEETVTIRERRFEHDAMAVEEDVKNTEEKGKEVSEQKHH